MLENYPAWVQQLARKYVTKTIFMFTLHSNIHDLQPVKDGQSYKYLPLKDFLRDELFKRRDIVVFYDRASGISFRNAEMKQDFQRALTAYDTLYGTNFAISPPKDPVRAFAVLENYFKVRIQDGKRIAMVIDYAETIIPMAEAAHYNAEDRAVLTFLHKWSHDHTFMGADITFILLAENLSDLNQQFRKNPYTAEIEIPFPDEEQRLAYIATEFSRFPNYADFFKVSPAILGKHTAGMNLINLKTMIAEVKENTMVFDYETLKQKKKEIIEAEAGGLLEFVYSKYALADVAGHKYAKKHLLETAHAIKQGRQDVVPMGYLVSGPVGTGKTFLVSCFANDIGIPMVMLKNFRSQWQGVTEGNLEKVLKILKAMTPVAVMIDEADAYLGDRNNQGDSGVSNRVFSMIATFMSNTEHRGKIIWFLMTARPDLMPIDFKRQGRAEEHIALFYPQTLEEKKELFAIMLKKTGIKNLTVDQIPEQVITDGKVFSGADIEAALTRAKFRAVSEGANEVTPEIIQKTFDDFLPPTYPEEVELMNYAAVLECTSKDLLPEKYRVLSRAEVVAKIKELKMYIE